MTIKIAIAYHSSYGHTEKVALAVAEGARSGGAEVALVKVAHIDEAGWAALDGADAIVFGAPTFMGGVSAPFKVFIDSVSKRWQNQTWKNKIAAGFTNSGSVCGDKQTALIQLFINAMQHSMIWVGQAEMPPSGEPLPTDVNRMGSSLGLMTQSGNDSPEVTPPEGDLETARRFGRRVVEMTAKFL